MKRQITSAANLSGPKQGGMSFARAWFAYFFFYFYYGKAAV